MSTYELTFLVEDSKPLKKLEEILTSFEGKKLSENAWGKRELAYPIEKIEACEYYTWIIELDPKTLNDFKTKLNYENLLVRYLFLAHDGTPSSTQKKPAKKTPENKTPENEE